MANFFPTEFDRYLFHEGRHWQSYNILGAHLCEKDDKKGTRFTVWAPAAQHISVVGDFNNWDDSNDKMKKIEDSGLWTIFIPGNHQGKKYKYKIKDYKNIIREKADPFGFYAEKPPATASIVYSLTNYQWNDRAWLDKRKDYSPYQKPLLIYELHPGSWLRENEKVMNYRQLADRLITYLSDMGYTHVELMPVTEYPFDGSWGYQTTGYYAVTSRYGTPDDFMYFVDRCHQHNIGVIVDWVPGHFCKDDHGLRLFDGTHLYENKDPRRAENQQWDTLNFDFTQPEVWSFLISSAYFWFEKYHIDGIRVDAVSNIIYLDYGKEDGQWVSNKYGGNEDLEAIKFLKTLNTELFQSFPGILMIAEESTTWPLVTAPVDKGGLGFNFKWNMGWMNDTLAYMENDPLFRKNNHNQLTFSIMYTYSENYILPLSHDEVVHGKKSLLDKMPGDYWQKFANLRLLYGYMMSHPGKKMLFMGGEFGQFIEWNYKQGLDWHLMDYEMHNKMKTYVKKLNHFYLQEPALWEMDFKEKGFEWIEANDYQHSVISYIRYDTRNTPLIIICNFTPVIRKNYQIGVPGAGTYREVFNSDFKEFGGCGRVNNSLQTIAKNLHEFPNCLTLTLPPLAVIYLKHEY